MRKLKHKTYFCGAYAIAWNGFYIFLSSYFFRSD
nr:MAG TPA: hypothetical protein [Caudoviricetes sp.]